ncbi:MAG: hypothetical protein HY537_06535 [Deltaproteobacteria bacterium]|nr:hypothetical protein [Deltaproteobacteria bacterium]
MKFQLRAVLILAATTATVALFFNHDMRCPFGTVSFEENGAKGCVLIKVDGTRIKNGPYVEKKGSIVLVKGSYKLGKLDGYWERWHENGLKRSETYYHDGKRNGRYVSWHSNGKLETRANYLMGKLHGAYRYYEPNGEPAAALTYENDEYTGKQTYWLNKIRTEFEPLAQEGSFYVTEFDRGGNKRIEGVLNDGFMNGHFIQWHTNGKKAAEGEFIRNLPRGQFIFSNSRGEKEVVVQFKKDHGVHLIWAKNEKMNKGYFLLSDFTFFGVAKCPPGLQGERGLSLVDGRKMNSCMKPVDKGNSIAHGQTGIFYRNGQRASVGGFYNNYRYGKWLFWSEDGTLDAEGYYDRGEIVAVKGWHKNGKLRFLMEPVEEALIGLPTRELAEVQSPKTITGTRFAGWDQNGKKFMEVVWYANEVRGRVVEFYPNGEKAAEGFIDTSAKPVGLWNIWPENSEPYQLNLDYTTQLKHIEGKIPKHTKLLLSRRH